MKSMGRTPRSMYLYFYPVRYQTALSETFHISHLEDLPKNFAIAISHLLKRKK